MSPEVGRSKWMGIAATLKRQADGEKVGVIFFNYRQPRELASPELIEGFSTMLTEVIAGGKAIGSFSLDAFPSLHSFQEEGRPRIPIHQTLYEYYASPQLYSPDGRISYRAFELMVNQKKQP